MGWFLVGFWMAFSGVVFYSMTKVPGWLVNMGRLGGGFVVSGLVEVVGWFRNTEQPTKHQSE